MKQWLKKNVISPVWWEMKKLPPAAALIDYRTDKFFNEWMPAIYLRHGQKPVDEKKVVLVENQPAGLGNAFTLLYRDLKKDGEFRVHIHHIGNGLLPKKQWEKNCAKMVADIATARYVFLSEASGAVSCLPLREETVVTQLWHGCGAFKKFGRSTADAKFGLDRQHADRHPLYQNYSYVTVSSPEVVWAYAEAMGLEEKKDVIRPVGVSRTDVFFRKDFLSGAPERVYRVVPQARGKRIVLYAPTFRGRIALATSPDYQQFDLRKLREKLGDETIILIKHHPNVSAARIPKIPEDLEGCFAVDVTKDLEIDELMCAADVCITDYSSLIFEYSLLDKPLVFYAYDLDEYDDWRGFYYDYSELTPGPVCRNMEELAECLSSVQQSYDREQMQAFRDKYMRSCDGYSTRRIEEMVFGRSLKPEDSDRAEI